MNIDTAENQGRSPVPNRSKAEAPRAGGFASQLPEDAAYAVEVCRAQDSVVTCRVQLRLEPEHGPAPRRS